MLLLIDLTKCKSCAVRTGERNVHATASDQPHTPNVVACCVVLGNCSHNRSKFRFRLIDWILGVATFHRPFGGRLYFLQEHFTRRQLYILGPTQLGTHLQYLPT